jgi:replicative DNA helicase
MNDFNKSLPHSHESEKTILGAVLLDERLITELINHLKVSDFYSPLHSRVFWAMSELCRKNQQINVVLIAEELKKRNELDNIGGVATIVNLAHGLPHFSNLKAYIDIVLTKSKLRQLIKTCSNTINEVMTQDVELAEILDSTEQSVFNLRNQESNTAIEFNSLLETSVTDLYERMQPNYEPQVLRTGFIDIDNKIFGFDKTDLIVIGGRPSQGKTTFSLNVVNNITEDLSKRVLYFSLEMSKNKLTDKIICLDAGVNYTQYRKGLLSKADYELIKESFARLRQKQIAIDDSSGLTPLQLKARARREIQKHKQLHLIVVDYMQMMRGNGKFTNRESEVAQISKDLKSTAKDLGVPIVAICSLNRASEARADKRPQMSDLRESGQIESDADQVMFIHRPEMYAKDENEKFSLLGQAEVIIAKNREGETGFEKLTFDGKTSKFMNYQRF